ncbi:hypothetical protein AK812_SmicGene23773 [Symbiodinium microadriaticum]|uniref:Uncharacterized protein n=1 Tax=Symbiodinium microadriaticum TaxID=2951 RepID=A0A1Q9DGA6_SYMMI|nr:hypothetical protein AK812_SmicGene23773 [Symbiodinium microadriaticum]
MAAEALATDLRAAHLTDTVGLDFCPVIYRFPDQLCGSWSAKSEGPWAKAFFGCRGRCDGPRLDQDKTWQLMLYTWLGAGGLDGLPWKHICATGDLTRYDSSSEQAMAVIKFATSHTQLCGKHVLKFFGSDGRDKGLRFSQDELLMLKAWHEEWGIRVVWMHAAQGLTYKVSAGWSPRDNMAIIPRFDGALTALEDLAADLRAHLTDTVGLDLRPAGRGIWINLDAGGDAMDQDKMWQLKLINDYAAGGGKDPRP